jgi:hypothetical protein
MGAKYIGFGDVRSFPVTPSDKPITIISAACTIFRVVNSAANAPPEDAPIAKMLLPSFVRNSRIKSWFNTASIRRVSRDVDQQPLFRSTLDTATGMYPLSMTMRTILNSSDKPKQLGQVDGDGEKNFKPE